MFVSLNSLIIFLLIVITIFTIVALGSLAWMKDPNLDILEI